MFARAGLANGNIEPYDFTDVDRTVSAGVAINGKQWGRPDDTFGFAGVVNGITSIHQQFLNDGGLGILVGDGQLPHPGPEKIIETYYQLPGLVLQTHRRLSVHCQSRLQYRSWSGLRHRRAAAFAVLGHVRFVMPALVAGIHALFSRAVRRVAGRNKSGQDGLVAFIALALRRRVDHDRGGEHDVAAGIEIGVDRDRPVARLREFEAVDLPRAVGVLHGDAASLAILPAREA